MPYGRNIKLSRPQAAGTYTVTLDAATFPSGMYLYRLDAGHTVRIRTFTLLKENITWLIALPQPIYAGVWVEDFRFVLAFA